MVFSGKRFMTSIRETSHTHCVPLYLTEHSPIMSTQKNVKYHVPPVRDVAPPCTHLYDGRMGGVQVVEK